MTIGLILAVVLAAQPPMDSQVGGAGSTPVRVQPLAANEMLLELAGTGIEYQPADIATLKVRVSARGPTEAAARAERDAVVERITKAARGAGVAAADVEAGETAVYELDVFDVESPPPPEVEPPAPSPATAPSSTTPPSPVFRVQLEPPPRQQPRASTTVTITLRNLSRLSSLKAALTAAGGELIGEPDLRLSDDVAARRAARSKAYARGRADADAFAATMNMRVVRVARVTERAGFDFMSMMMADIGGAPGRLRAMHEVKGGMVPTIVFLGMDFVLAPR
jgi:uncharacterized protein YggE